MPTPDDDDRRLLTSAVVRAVMDARWHCADLLSRKPITAVPDLLRGQSGELAFSGLARDQLLGLALLATAAEVERVGAAAEVDALTILTQLQAETPERAAVHREALGSDEAPSTRSEEVAGVIEQRLQSNRRSRSRLAAMLGGEARLQELLWDNPGLSCNAATRRLMLFAAPRLLQRAAELGQGRRAAPVTAPDPAAAPRAAPARRRRWFGRPLWGMLPQGWLMAAAAVLAAAGTGLLAEG